MHSPSKFFSIEILSLVCKSGFRLLMKVSPVKFFCLIPSDLPKLRNFFAAHHDFHLNQFYILEKIFVAQLFIMLNDLIAPQVTGEPRETL